MLKVPMVIAICLVSSNLNASSHPSDPFAEFNSAKANITAKTEEVRTELKKKSLTYYTYMGSSVVLFSTRLAFGPGKGLGPLAAIAFTITTVKLIECTNLCNKLADLGTDFPIPSLKK